MLFNIEFDVTVFDVPVFDVTHLYLIAEVKRSRRRIERGKECNYYY